MLNPNKIEILDSTLREGEQTPGVSFSINEKVIIAKLLDEIGVDFIEIGHPAVSDDLYESVVVLNDLNLKANRIVHGRSMKSDINDAYTIGVPWMGMFFGTSTLSLKLKHNMTQNEALNKIETAIKYGKDKGLKIRFTAEDATRTNLDFLLKVAEVASLAGADRFSIADTVGVFTSEKVKYLVKSVVRSIDIPVHLHCHNDFGLATSNSLAGLRSGARCVDVTANSLGERSGLASLAEVLLSLVELYGIKSNWDLSKIINLSSFVEEASGIKLQKNSPILGRNAFRHKAGLHTKAILINPSSYEAISPKKLNLKRSYSIDKYSGVSSILDRFKKIGIKLNKPIAKDILLEIKSKPNIANWSDKELKKILEKKNNNYY